MKLTRRENNSYGRTRAIVYIPRCLLPYIIHPHYRNYSSSSLILIGDLYSAVCLWADDDDN